MSNQDQREFWNEEAGSSWVAHTSTVDLLMTEVTDRLLQLVEARPGQRVLDVGCGGGQTSRELARAVGERGRVLGLDLSRPLVELARRTAGEDYPQLIHEQGDAQTHALEPRAYDAVVSRFGIMFFDDPVTALRNLRSTLNDRGRLVFVCWAPAESNPLFSEARRIVTEHLGAPDQAESDPRAPGPFAFADDRYVDDLLRRSGFSHRRHHRASPALRLDSVEQGVELMSHLGPASRRMDELEATTSQREAVAHDLQEFLEGKASADGSVTLGSDLFFWVAHV